MNQAVPPVFKAEIDDVATIGGKRIVVSVRQALDDAATITIAEAHSQPDEREPWRFTFDEGEWRRMTALLDAARTAQCAQEGHEHG